MKWQININIIYLIHNYIKFFENFKSKLDINSRLIMIVLTPESIN